MDVDDHGHQVGPCKAHRGGIGRTGHQSPDRILQGIGFALSVGQAPLALAQAELQLDQRLRLSLVHTPPPLAGHRIAVWQQGGPKLKRWKPVSVPLDCTVNRPFRASTQRSTLQSRLAMRGWLERASEHGGAVQVQQAMPWNQSQLAAAFQTSATDPRDLQERAVGPPHTLNLIDEETSNVGHEDEQKAEQSGMHMMHRDNPTGTR
ncbi:hypothetical protein G6F65_013700 [Rhizopus arrhizus]|nr:hypothetical protein G6F65_013700 [Rhizopus arrhizus]